MVKETHNHVKRTGSFAKTILYAMLSTGLMVSTTASPAVAKPEKHKHHARVITVMDTLVAAYMNNPAIKEGRANLRAADEGVTQALGGWRPKIDLQLSAQLQKQINSGDAKSGRDGALTPSQNGSVNSPILDGQVTLSQNLYQGGKTIADTLVAENNVLLNRAKLLSTEQQILLAAITAHIDVVYRREDLASLNEYLGAVQESLRAANEKFNVGEETTTAVAQAQAVVDQARAQIDEGEANLAAAEATYEQVIGLRPGNLESVKTIPNLPATLRRAIDIAKQKNPDVAQAKYDEAVARNQIDSVAADMKGSLDLQATTERNDKYTRYSIHNQVPGVIYPPGYTDYGSRDKFTQHSASLTFKIPIYEQGVIRSKTRAAYENAESKRVAIHRVMQKNIQDTTSQWSNYQGFSASSKMSAAEAKSYAVSVEGTRQEMLVGSKILLDVLNEQQKLIGAQRRAIASRRAAAVAGYTLILQIGEMTAKDLKLRIARYDPEAHYRDVRNKW